MIDPAHWRSGRTYEGEYATVKREIGDAVIQYTDWNPKSARVLLLIHGINVQGHTWDPIASAMAGQGFRVLCPDLRGHGGSSWPPSGYRIESFAADQSGLLDTLGIKVCDIVGHSLGARVAVVLAATWNGKVNHVALSDAGPEMLTAGLKRASQRASARLERRGFDNAEEAMKFYEEMHAEWEPVFRELHVRHQLRLNWAGKLVERTDPDLYWITRSAGRADPDHMWHCARVIAAPVRLYWGATSPYFDQGLVEKYRREFRHFSDVKVDSGHYVPREKPALFCQDLTTFLAE